MSKYRLVSSVILYVLAAGVFLCSLLYAMTARAGGEINSCKDFDTLGSTFQRVYVRSVVSEKVTLQPMSVKACARLKTDGALTVTLRTCRDQKNLGRALAAAVRYVLIACDFQPVEDTEWDSWNALERSFSELEVQSWD